MAPNDRPTGTTARPNRWLRAALRPLHLAAGAVGPLLAALDPQHLLWAAPATALVYGVLVARDAAGAGPAREPPPDPLAAAGPAIEWEIALAAATGLEARALIERLARVDREATRLAREAAPDAQPLLAVALGQLREVARTGLEVARALDRVAALLAAARPAKARVDSLALHVRAMVQRDRAAAEALYTAAERQAAYADRGAELAVLRVRLAAEGERVVAELSHAALDFARLAAGPLTTSERVRIDPAVVREALGEVAAFEAQLAGAEEPVDAVVPAASSRRET